MPTLTDKEREYVAIGAAIGAGCRPCTRYHVGAAQKAGLSEDEIRLAVKDAEALRVDAVAGIADYAQHLLGGETKGARCLYDPAERSQALAMIGAATGGNAGHLLDWLLPQARGLGMTNDALREAVQTATAVKGVAADFCQKDAERALALENEVASPAADGECVATAPAESPGLTATVETTAAAAGRRDAGSCC